MCSPTLRNRERIQHLGYLNLITYEGNQFPVAMLLEFFPSI